VTKWCRAFSKRRGLPHIHPHSFRHSAASMLVFGGADLASIAHRLGHAQISTTMDIYSHAIHEADQKNAAILSEVVLKKVKNA
ncbi:MAG: tyrosine-type recombinase/integrase, partial [Oscillospiraceae bacterium]|nr:tyrosine-type recombinase/integrase [Oscillospiraceae bacterium]